MSNRWNDKPLELYLHIPFCIQKCAYCDFLSGPWDTETQKAYAQALQREIRAAAKEAEGRTVSTVFVGGGTPSVLPVNAMADILEELHKQYKIAPDAEISMEANPGTLHEGQLQDYRRMGINRLSMGLQSTFDRELAMLGRIHSYAEFQNNYEAARNAGFSNVNVDLMFALPGQTRASWQQTLRKVAVLSPEHLSAYSLIVEEGTPFASRTLDLPDEDTEYAMYEDTASILAEYGYRQYEISNYAKPGFECRHNLGYWERTDYQGLGLGASSLWTTPDFCEKRFHNTSSMQKYLSHSSELSVIREETETLTREDAMAEFMFLGLRKTAGVSEEEFRRAFGCEIDGVYGDVLNKYEKLGMLTRENGRIALTRAGIHVSNVVMADFL